jgi:hypothetical protein
MSTTPKGRPRKGRRVAFTRTGRLAPDRRADAVAGLRFTIDTAHGGLALIDLVALRPRRLALAFGSALPELAPTIVRSTVIQHVNGLKRFFQFLNETAASLDGPSGDRRRSHRDRGHDQSHASDHSLSFYRRFHLLGLEEGGPIRDLHARRYLLAEDIIAFFVALSLETGLAALRRFRLLCE